jgi:signal transduction histidine kinase
MPRPVLLPVLLIAACALGLGLALHGRSLPDSHFLLTGVCALANVLSAAAAFARAGEFPGEARGWRLLGGSLALLTLANLALGLGHRYPTLVTVQTTGPVLLGFSSQVLSTAALLLMPWGATGLRWRARNVLGSCLFVGSILAILWTLTDWNAAFGSHNMVNLALLAACGRLALLGGITLMLIEQDPRRLRGVLGFVLVNVLLGGIYVALLQTLLVRGRLGVLPLAGVYSLAPLILGLAAWSRAPLEFPERPLASNRVWEFIPYVSFALAAGAILLSFLLHGTLPKVPLVVFIGLTWLLLLRQFMLLRDLRRQNQSLEGRVQERTRALESMQAVVLRTERLNTLCTLGAGIAHDLNNFLGVIHTSVQLIEQEPDGGPATRDRHLARIQASSERAIALTGRLLGFARRDAEPRGRLDLAEALLQLEDLLRMLLPRNIGLSLELAPGPFPVFTRKANLEQILVNLVGNAKDAMPGGGAVTIRLGVVPGPEGARIQLQVEDTGPGLPPMVLEHLFEIFITTKGEGKGTGLGLATVKALVEGDGGTVSVRSGPGTGCRFLISYPTAVRQPEPEAVAN